AAPRGGHLVVLREDGDLPAIVLLHPIGGLLAGYGSLVRHLRGVAPLFGVLAHARERPQYRTVAERCAAYVDEIMAGTNGPVALAGYSLGGVLAMECAAQLTARGREVRLVTLFDTWVPRPPRRRLEKVLFRISELRRFSWEERARWAELQLARHFKPEQEAPEAGEELAAFDVAASDELGRQALAWRPSPYAGQVLLFRSERDLRGYSNRPSKLGWDTVAPHLTVENVPVDHTRIMREPHIALIADRILRALAR
ncbi:MAG TPA: thioesterase domain-containing protein, partial [Myxococcota bacterium]|nr:thioesterase domain-containing protein [Myxococcota bacterium]